MLSTYKRVVRRKQGRFPAALTMLGCVLSIPLVVSAAQELPLSLDETVRRADAIVLGTVTSRQSRWGDDSRRWMVTDYTLAVEKVLHPSERGEPIADTVVLTYWGGTIGSESQGISDLRLPAVGEQLLMMLRPDWARTLGFSPVVGLNQGLFKLAADASGTDRAAPIVLDAGGQQLALAAGGAVQRGMAAPSNAGGVSLAAFEEWLAANLSRIKSTPSDIRLEALQDAGQLMTGFAKTPSSEVQQADRQESGARGRVPSEAADVASVPAMPPDVRAAGFDMPAAAMPSSSEYVTLGPKPNLPIVVNNFPNSFSPWSPEDESQMAKWNYYADVFRVYTTPTGSFAWRNNVFDLAGWPNSATLQSVYGSGWDATTIGVTFWRSSGATVLEADIALNPAFGFTLDDEWVYDGSSAQGFRLVMLHELGHMLGLDHNFNGMAIMNYFPSVFRAFSMPYMDDAAGIRALYPGNAVSRTDLGVYLYYASGYQSVSDATFPSSAVAGGNLTVNNFTIENVGTTTISTPTIEWFLTTARNFNSTYYYLGESTYGPALGPFTYYNPASVGRTLTVPSSVPAGSYYLSAFIRNDAGATQGGFAFSNNFAFSRRRIAVTLPPPSTPVLVSPANNSINVTRTPILDWNASSGATSYDVYFGTTPTPSFYVNTTATSYAVGTLNLATKYYWYVVARNSSGTSSSSIFSFTTVNLAAPALVSPANNATNVPRTPTLSWTASSGATSYDVYFGTGASPAFYANTSGTSLGVGPLSASTRYYWNVVARSSGGVSSPSTTFNFTTAAGANQAALVFRNTQSGDVGGWLLNGFALAQTGMIYSGLPLAWRIDGVGDLDGDGKTDVVFRNEQTGDVAAWLLNGTSIKQTGMVLAGLPMFWQIVRVGDLNGDGKADLVFRNTQTGDVAAWLMNGLVLAQGAIIYSGLPMNWWIDGIGDLNADGRADLLFRNTTTGDVAAWLMNGFTLVQGAIIYSGLPLAWRIDGLGDVNNDGRADLVFRNTQTGDVAGWLMNGFTLVQGAIIYSGLPLAWQIDGTADLNGDGKTDLVFRNIQAGDVAGWLLNGVALSQGGMIYSGLPMVWRVNGVGDPNAD